MKNNGRKLLLWCLFFVFLSLTLNFVKQVTIQLKASRELNNKKLELNDLKEKNKQLRAKLEEIKSPTFLKNEAATVLGLSERGESVILNEDKKEAKSIQNQLLEPKTPIFKRWLSLFIY